MNYRSGLAQWLSNQQDGQCYYCCETIDWKGDKSHIDHKTAQSRSGTDDLFNLCLTCPTCNLLKSSLNEDEFKKSLVIKYDNGAGLRQDEDGKVVVYHPFREYKPFILKCMHGVYDPMKTGVVSEHCSICSGVCPITERQRDWIHKLKQNGLIKQIEGFWKKICAPWKRIVKYWWDKECYVK